jgi:hypothetical protein
MKKKIFMYKTKHAKTRQQQRGIKNETVDLLLQYGKKTYKNNGTAVLCFPRCIQTKLVQEHKDIKNLISAYALITTNENRIITVGHRYKKSLTH